MELKNLRIGNLIETTSGLFPDNPIKKQWFISEEDMVQIIESDKKYRYEGIQLTEEWLLKCGFKNEYDHYWTNEKMPFFKLLGNGIGADYNNGWRMYDLAGNTIIFAIKYVHELQNLFFALTGTEIII